MQSNCVWLTFSLSPSLFLCALYGDYFYVHKTIDWAKSSADVCFPFCHCAYQSLPIARWRVRRTTGDSSASVTQCAKGSNAGSAAVCAWSRSVCGFEFWSVRFTESRSIAVPQRVPLRVPAYNGSTALAIWRCTVPVRFPAVPVVRAVRYVWASGYMAGVSRVEKREHEKAEKQTTQDNFGELFTSNRIFRQKRKNQFLTKINIFFHSS